MKEMSQNSPANPYNVYYNNYLDTAAGTECTGLIHRAAADLKEWENYKDIINFLPASPGSNSFDLSEDKK